MLFAWVVSERFPADLVRSHVPIKIVADHLLGQTENIYCFFARTGDKPFPTDLVRSPVPIEMVADLPFVQTEKSIVVYMDRVQAIPSGLGQIMCSNRNGG